MHTQKAGATEKQQTHHPQITREHSTGGTATLVDNRPTTVLQRRLRESRAATDATPRTPQGSPRFQQIATAMGASYGVDTSSLKATHNSSFPATVNAAATIQGRNIHFAPGMDTDYNIKHEVAHAIDNTLYGTPPGDRVVQGNRVDTTREQVVDRMARKYTFEGQTSTTRMSRARGSSTNQIGINAEGFPKTTPSTTTQTRVGQSRVHRADTPHSLTPSISREINTLQCNDWVGEEQENYRGPDKDPFPDLQADVGSEKGIPNWQEFDNARPDDVPPHQAYRALYHDLLSSLYVVGPEHYGNIHNHVEALKTGAKKAAKRYKKNMRLVSEKTIPKVEIEQQYMSEMNQLVTKVEKEASELIKLHKEGLVPAIGEWGEIRIVVDTALKKAWPKEKSILRQTLISSPPEVNEELGLTGFYVDYWGPQVTKDPMALQYGGSLARGWKGPPKQGVMMYPYSFDVDANLTSHTVAILLLLKGLGVDRGQIRRDPEKTGEKELLELDKREAGVQEVLNAELAKHLKKKQEYAARAFAIHAPPPQKMKEEKPKQSLVKSMRGMPSMRGMKSMFKKKKAEPPKAEPPKFEIADLPGRLFSEPFEMFINIEGGIPEALMRPVQREARVQLLRNLWIKYRNDGRLLKALMHPSNKGLLIYLTPMPKKDDEMDKEIYGKNEHEFTIQDKELTDLDESAQKQWEAIFLIIDPDAFKNPYQAGSGTDMNRLFGVPAKKV